MLDLFALVDRAISAVPIIVRYWTSPVSVEVIGLRYTLIENRPDDVVFHVTGYPQRYSLALRLTNRRMQAQTHIKSIKLVVNSRLRLDPIDDLTKLLLGPHEYREFSLTFPWDDSESPPDQGFFEVEVTPAVGRSRIVRGRFPI